MARTSSGDLEFRNTPDRGIGGMDPGNFIPGLQLLEWGGRQVMPDQYQPLGMNGKGGGAGQPQYGSGGGMTPGGQAGTSQDKLIQMLMDFFTKMNGPLDTNDPMVKSILGGAYSTAAQDALGRGINGGLGIQSAQQAYVNSAAQMQQQRQQMGLGALGQAAGFNQQNLENIYGSQMNQYNMGMNQAQSQGGSIGSMLGGLGGLALTAATGGAAAPFIPGLTQLGAGLGSSFGGQNYGGQMPSFGGGQRGMMPSGRTMNY